MTTDNNKPKIVLRPDSTPIPASQTQTTEITDPTFQVSYGDEPKTLETFRKNPLVPAGAALTAGVLCAGLIAFQRGNSVLSQRLMRARIFAQGATLAVLAGSVSGILGMPATR